jgi:PAS domain S-box-containing protein
MSMIKAGLKQGVFAFALIAIVLPLVIIGGVFLSYFKHETTAEINDDNLHLAEIIRDGVSNSLKAPYRTLNVVAGLAVHPDFAPHIDDLMAQMVSSYGFFESIMVLDRNGIVRHLGTASNVKLNRQEFLGIDLSESEHIETARRLKQQTWSDTYISTLTGEPTLSLTVPFDRGMVVGNFNFAELTTAVEQHLSQSHDRIYLVNSKGRIIAHPQKTLVLQQVNVSNLPVVRAGLEGREGIYEYDVEGVEFIGAVVNIPETNWLVIVERDKGEVFRSLRNMQWFFAIALAGALLLVAIFIGYVNIRIIKPIVNISTTTKNIANGYFLQVPRYESQFNELNDLAGNFNTMTTALQEREQDLADKNRDLEEEVERRIRSEEEVRQSEDKLKLILENLPSAVYILGYDGRALYINKAASVITAYTRDELMNMPFLTLVHPEDHAMIVQRRADRAAGKPVESGYTFRVLDKTGTVHWAENQVIVLPWEGKPAVLNYLQDITVRKRAEEALRRETQFFESLFHTLPGPAYVFGVDGQFLRWNRYFETVMGYTPADMAKMNALETIVPSDRESVAREIEKVFREGYGAIELHSQTAEGKVIPHYCLGALMDIEGTRYLIGVGVDMTARNRAEEELAKSEERFRVAFSTNPDAIIISRIDNGVLIDVNQGFVELIGYTKEEVVNKQSAQELGIWDIPADRQRFMEELKTKRTIDNQETRFRSKSGKVIFGSVSARMIMLNDVPHALWIGKDITDRKQAEAERERLIAEIQNVLGLVSRSQKEWQDTFDSITDMISIHDKDYNVIRANKAFSKSVGMSPREVINRKCYDLLHHGASSPVSGCPHVETMKNKVHVSEEVFDEITNKTYYVSTYPYFSPDGEFIGSIHISRDITEDKEREMRMIMTERLASLGQMASGIAHEINNPLESVMICAEMLLMRVAKDTYDHAQFEKYLKIIDEEVLRCRDITGNMLSFSRQTTMSRSDIDVHFLLDRAIDLVGYQGRLKNVTVTKKYREKLLVSGNEGELRQVFLVLLINALDAMENKGAITVETGMEEGGVWIKISDTGQGIAPENLQRIFNPFFSTKTEKGGTGLGLSIAHRIMANHQGSLTVVSEQGHGAAFTVNLPR